MHADIRIYGEPEEIGRCLRFFQKEADISITIMGRGISPVTIPATPAASPPEDFDLREEPVMPDEPETPFDATRAFVDLDTARHILTKKPLSPEQLAMLNVLYRTKGWVASPVLCEAIGVLSVAFRGFMGGWGLRVTGSKCYGKTKPLFIDQMKSGSVNHYRLPQVARVAMWKEKLVEF